jgi:hypothetical protein
MKIIKLGLAIVLGLGLVLLLTYGVMQAIYGIEHVVAVGINNMYGVE